MKKKRDTSEYRSLIRQVREIPTDIGIEETRIPFMDVFRGIERARLENKLTSWQAMLITTEALNKYFILNEIEIAFTQQRMRYHMKCCVFSILTLWFLIEEFVSYLIAAVP